MGPKPVCDHHAVASDRDHPGELDLDLEWPGGGGFASPRPSADVTTEPGAPRPAGAASAPLTGEVVLPNEALGGSFLVQAYDRFAARVLERLGSLREDVDLDLAAMRSEMASLRQAIDDLAGRSELRNIRAGIDELRSDVVALRRAVLEWPELAHVSSELTSIRADLSPLIEEAAARQEAGPMRTAAASAGMPELGETLESLRASVEKLGDRPALGAFAPLVEEVAALREEVQALRRRTALRAGAAPADAEVRAATPEPPPGRTRRSSGGRSGRH